MKKFILGILLCLAIAVPSWFLVMFVPALEVIGAPVIAIIVGMILSLIIKKKGVFTDGIAFTSKKILQYAVILLGFGLNLATIGKVGLTSLPIILSTIATSLIVAFVMYKLLKVPSKTATLIGVGSSICGGSAIAATAPVIDADDEEIAQSISVIFLFNVIAALIFPTLGGFLGMSNEGFALFAGTAVNDTSSVTAAASTWDSMHGTGSMVLDSATIVKLTRTLAIIPITLVLAFVRMRKEKSGNTGSKTKVSLKKIFPMFILYFVLASVITTIATSVLTGQALDVANSIFGFLKQLSKFFIVMAMAAIGLNTNIVKLVKTGGKPILLGFTCWVAITGVSILMQHVLGIW
ncbi:YeiH family protein [Ruminococcus sp.]|uniref:YeiH family protein n=1 Tax=Ruminococcus sp. TaxID=41978 RepID=UPI0025CDA785|nr:YeiH family protein [Ruminococcus sp.]MCI6616480.1 YeiH family protein [Ruminococcus sp.]